LADRLLESLFRGHPIEGMRLVYGKVPHEYTQTIAEPTQGTQAAPLGVICALTLSGRCGRRTDALAAVCLTRVGITAIPVDRHRSAAARNVSVPVYFTISRRRLRSKLFGPPHAYGTERL
jgi:hypothetical protein